MRSRAERSFLGEWWWTVDRLLVAAFVSLMIAGIVLSFAASPPVAERLGLPLFHFVNRHLFFLAPAIVVMVITSFLGPRDVRRLAIVLFAIGILMMAATLFVGAEIKGAR